MIEKLRRLKQVLTVPAAEYVPAIVDAWFLIDELIAAQPAQAAPEPFHPDASHIPPDYRDGWNACLKSMPASGYGPKHFEQASGFSVPAPVQAGEPVAWIVYLPSQQSQTIYDSQDDIGYVDDLTNNDDAKVTPLYTHPAPPMGSQDRRDAERYRELRKGENENAIDSIYPFSMWENTHWLKRGKKLDAAIDAMLATKQEPTT